MRFRFRGRPGYHPIGKDALALALALLIGLASFPPPALAQQQSECWARVPAITVATTFPGGSIVYPPFPTQLALCSVSISFAASVGATPIRFVVYASPDSTCSSFIATTRIVDVYVTGPWSVGDSVHVFTKLLPQYGLCAYVSSASPVNGVTFYYTEL